MSKTELRISVLSPYEFEVIDWGPACFCRDCAVPGRDGATSSSKTLCSYMSRCICSQAEGPNLDPACT